MSKARSATVESSEAARMSLFVHEGRESNQVLLRSEAPGAQGGGDTAGSNPRQQPRTHLPDIQLCLDRRLGTA